MERTEGYICMQRIYGIIMTTRYFALMEIEKQSFVFHVTPLISSSELITLRIEEGFHFVGTMETLDLKFIVIEIWGVH